MMFIMSNLSCLFGSDIVYDVYDVQFVYQNRFMNFGNYQMYLTGFIKFGYIDSRMMKFFKNKN